MNVDLNRRFWEIDSLRGLAIVMMVIFHLIFDLYFFGIYSFNVHSGFLWWFARITAFIFIFLVGVSLSLSYSRTTLSASYGSQKDLSFQVFKKRTENIWIWTHYNCSNMDIHWRRIYHIWNSPSYWNGHYFRISLSKTQVRQFIFGYNIHCSRNLFNEL